MIQQSQRNLSKTLMLARPAASKSTQSDGDSDSDWDDDDNDFATRKINIKINPIAPITPSKISASVDELRATVGTWKSLANVNLIKPNSRRHHQSTVQLNNITNHDQQANLITPFATSSVILPNNLVSTNGETLIQEQCDNSNNLRHSLHLNGSSSSAAILTPKIRSDFTKVLTIASNEIPDEKLPVAFAIQECLNASLFKGPDGNGSANLIGRLKMAVPPQFNGMELLNENLEITLVTSMPWERISFNQDYVREIDEQDLSRNSASNDSTKRLLIDMKAIHSYTKKQNQKQPNAKYYLLPELLNYNIRSRDHHESTSDISASSLLRVTPVHVVSHWLCDLNITKVRVNVQFFESTLNDYGLTTDDIKNLKFRMCLNGGVVSYQSKPEANWNPLNSELTWSFTNLTELIQKSTQNGVTSCLARFDLNDGPSAPSDVCLQFSIGGKTISGSRVVLDSTNNYRLAKQKYHVKTGAFRCQPSCI